MKEGLFKELASLVRELAKTEVTSTAGRVNIIGLVLSVLLAISLSLAPLFETLVRLFHPNESVGAPLVEIFALFCVFTIMCASMIAYMERSRKDKAAPPGSQDDSKPTADK